MDSAFISSWLWPWTSRPRGRRQPVGAVVTSLSTEILETRCLLSASRGGGGGQMVDVAADTDQQRDSAHAGRAAKKAVFPNMAGTWEMITHDEGGDIHGILVLTQKGKKVTGTLTNDLQPPGKVKFKLVAEKAAIASTKGNGINRVVSSRPSSVSGTVEDNDPGHDSDGDGDPFHDTDRWHGQWTTRDDIEFSAQFDALHTVFDD